GRTHKEDEVGGKRQEEEARQARSSARARQMSGPASAAGTTGDAARPGPRGIRERTGLSRPVSPRSWLGSSSCSSSRIAHALELRPSPTHSWPHPRERLPPRVAA
ncbi:unnamed protein product, partial [Prorocentrum cordatum]